MINKIVQSMAEAMAGIKDGSTVLIGGFGSVGQPNALIDGLIEQGAKDLTVVANNAGVGRVGLARLIDAGPGAQDHLLLPAHRRSGGVRGGSIAPGEIELGDRAAGHAGRAHARRRRRHPGLLHRRPAVGTKLAEGKESARVRRPRIHPRSSALHGDVALVEAWEADRWGNLVYRAPARNFNPVMATAAELTIAQTQHIVELGELDPEKVVTPGIFVDRVVHVPYGDPHAEDAD